MVALRNIYVRSSIRLLLSAINKQTLLPLQIPAINLDFWKLYNLGNGNNATLNLLFEQFALLKRF
jgi:hypothetical protein